MKVIDFREVSRVKAALSEISVIYQTPTWDSLGHDRKGRILNGFLLIEKGACLYEWQGGSAQLMPGSLIYLPRGSKRLVTVTERPFSFYRVSFTMTEAESGEEIIFCREPWQVFDNAGKNLFRICEEMLNSTLSQNTVFHSTALMYDFFHGMSKQLKPAGGSRIAPALEYLESHYMEEISVSALAELCYLCEAQLFHLFRKELGMSPVKYKNYLRIERAKMLLASGECSNAEIAAMLGFENVYYFGRVFRQMTGTSPTGYLKEILQ